MSAKATFWAWDQASKLSSTELLVLLSLANYANEDNELWYSYGRIASATRLSRQTVISKCQSLVDGGFLKIEHRTNKSGGDSSNLYTLSVPENVWLPVKDLDGGSQTDIPGGVNIIDRGSQRRLPKSKIEPNSIEPNNESKIYIYPDNQKSVSSERLYEHKKAGISIELPADISHAQFDQFVTHRIELSKSIKSKKINQRVAQLGLTQMQKLIAAGEDLSECLNVMEMKGWDQPYAVNKFNGGQNNATHQQVRRTGFAEPSRKFETIIPDNAPEWLRGED